MLAKHKVIATKEGLRCVCWTYRDVVHYGFETEDGEMLEVFHPTEERKGNALRAFVLKKFEKTEHIHYMGRWPSVAMDVDKIQVGMVLVWESGKGHVKFARVTSVHKSLIMGINNEGGQSMWLYETMNEKLQSREVQVIDIESVPEEFRHFERTGM